MERRSIASGIGSGACSGSRTSRTPAVRRTVLTLLRRRFLPRSEAARPLPTFPLRSRRMLVPFGEAQQKVVLAVPPPLRVVIYRRLMMRIAEKLARRWRVRALVTGEVIGQVASQTLDNLTVIAEAAS